MTSATRNRPIWHRLRDALADIERGLYPNRAFDFHRIPKHWRDDSRLHRRIAHAEAGCQRNAITAISAAGNTGYEDRLLDDGSGRARVAARTWKTKDWRAPAWLLERRFPQEYGQQQIASDSQAGAVLAALVAIAQGKQQQLPRPQPAIEARATSPDAAGEGSEGSAPASAREGEAGDPR